jgi:hypothetical protein
MSNSKTTVTTRVYLYLYELDQDLDCQNIIQFLHNSIISLPASSAKKRSNTGLKLAELMTFLAMLHE